MLESVTFRLRTGELDAKRRVGSVALSSAPWWEDAEVGGYVIHIDRMHPSAPFERSREVTSRLAPIVWNCRMLRESA